MPRPSRQISTLARLEALTPRQRATYSRTLHARRLMQNTGMSRKQAAETAGTTPRSMNRYLGGTIKKRGGRWHVRPGAELYRYVKVPTTSGMQTLPASSSESDLARRYRSALWRYTATGDESELLSLEGESIGGFTLETDHAEIEELIARGELDPRDVGSGETGR